LPATPYEPAAIFKADLVSADLYKFSSDVVSYGRPADEGRFKALGAQLGFELPLDFVYILSKHNSFDVAGTEVYGLDPNLSKRL